MTLFLSTTNTERQTGSAELAGFPPKPPRSKLEPHRELIRELRRKGGRIAKLPASSTSGWDFMSPSAHSILS